jgi:LPXTG-site transpeptidase (sortase) family protein
MRNARAHHQAQYDENGNIILPMQEEEVLQMQPEAPAPKIEHRQKTRTALPQEKIAAGASDVPSWVEALGDGGTLPLDRAPDTAPRIREVARDAQLQLARAMECIARESASQYIASFAGVTGVAAGARNGVAGMIGGFKAFLLQPVWIIKPKKAPKKYSRITLFTLDVVRFGGTFAFIFLGLFSALNYESFWQIAREKINPLEHAQAVQEQTAAIDTQLKEKLLKAPSLATAGEREEGNLLAALPQVGPPENRLIVPKLGLNVPLVTPSYASLLAEDWTKVEEDIQNALQLGAVHYPGTARPGQAGNFFVTGHSSYYPWAPGKYKTVFARLHNLDVGDEYYVYYGGDQHRYVIRSKEEVSPTNVNVLDQPINKRLATLMTCTPVGTTLRRLIILAEELDPVTGEVMAVGEHTQRPEHELNLEMLPI